MPELDLTAEEWQYISVLIANDVRREKPFTPLLAEKHLRIWEKIQPVCNWDDE